MVLPVALALVLWSWAKRIGERSRSAQDAFREMRTHEREAHLTMLAPLGVLSEAERGIRGEEQDSMIRKIYGVLAARFHAQGYRVEVSGHSRWVLSKLVGESLLVFQFGTLGEGAEILCGAGVCYQPVDELLSPVFLSHEVARRHSSSCTFTYIPKCDEAFRDCMVETAGRADQIAERVWVVWQNLQRWLEENSDLRKAAVGLEETWAGYSLPYSRTYARLIAAYHHLGDRTEEHRCLEAMVQDGLRCEPADLGASAPHEALELLRHLRWANLHLGLELPPLEKAYAWCRRCIEQDPVKAAQMSCSDDADDLRRIGFPQLLP